MKEAIFEIYDERFYQLVGRSGQLQELYDKAIWAEGPSWFAERQYLIFSDVKANKMYRWDALNGISVFRDFSHFANGNAVNQCGELISCEHGRRGISHTDKQGNVRLLVDRIEGKRLNSPNDVVVKSDGTIWFTDPPYGILSNDEGYQAPSEIIGCYVYCFDPIHNEINVATFHTMRPNGLAFSPDESQLFVADMSSIEFNQQGFNHLVVFDVVGKTLENRRTVAEINPGIPDGFCIDKQGVIYCSCATGLVVLLQDGTVLGRILLNKITSNCTFGDNDKTLFITASNSLYKLTIC